MSLILSISRLNAAIKCSIFFVLITAYYTSNAQFLSSEVISSSGNFLKNANAQIEFTIGELAVETYKNNGYLTQGFIQGSTVLLTSVNNHESSNLSQFIFFYPNPTNDNINIELPNIYEDSYLEFIITDLLGKELFRLDSKTCNNALSLYGFSSGVYLVKINSNNQFVKQLKVNKI